MLIVRNAIYMCDFDLGFLKFCLNIFIWPWRTNIVFSCPTLNFSPANQYRWKFLAKFTLATGTEKKIKPAPNPLSATLFTEACHPILFWAKLIPAQKALPSWFQTFSVFWMLYTFFWVIPWRLNFIYRRFGTLCLFVLHGQVDVDSTPTCL